MCWTPPASLLGIGLTDLSKSGGGRGGSSTPSVMPEGEKYWGCQVGDNLPSPVGIGLSDLPNIGEYWGITGL